MLMQAVRRRVGRISAESRERRELGATSLVSCDSGNLVQCLASDNLDLIFRLDQINEEWPAVERELAAMQITDRAGGVNPGDRRAIYYLIRHFQPREVLEIGTHIGASTLHIAAALRAAHADDPASTHHLTTVDVVDVNDPATAAWSKSGSTYSPRDMAERLVLDGHISFVTRRSLDYLASCSDRYDFVFLDGDHAPATVYRELPAALQALNPGGVVLLHDYFPELRPLWSDGTVIQGPWLATERLRSEGADFRVLPLGELPWGTKLESQTTSLALVVGS